MAPFSNGQRESSHSGDSSSSSDSDEQRLHANVNPSQREHSSTTSASSSDSEQEEVSTRAAPEKPAATPSLKKNPNSSDRSTVRNQSTPSEPNPNSRASASNPNTLSAAQPKKGVAAKRSIDDDLAEEQSESKRKKSVSKAKKVVQEEVAAASNPSNPSRKRLQKQLLVESPSPVPRVTRSAKHPQEKSSSKKKVRVWTTNEESVVMHCCLKYVMEGVELSKVAPKIKDTLDLKASSVQVYEKLRRMQRRYRSLKKLMLQGGIKEDAFVYKSPHEKELYKLWKDAWGEQHEEDEMEVHHTDASGDEAEEEEEIERDGGTDTVKEPKVRSTQKAPLANHIPAKPRVSSRLIPNNKSEDGLHYETILKEIGDLLAEVIGEVKKMAETSEAELKASLVSHLWPSLANGNFRS